MCPTAFDWELGEALGGTTIYCSAADFFANHPKECGVIKVRVEQVEVGLNGQPVNSAPEKPFAAPLGSPLIEPAGSPLAQKPRLREGFDGEAISLVAKGASSLCPLVTFDEERIKSNRKANQFIGCVAWRSFRRLFHWDLK